MRRLIAAIVVVLTCGAEAQQPVREQVVIPFLADAGKPADLSYEGGECDVDPNGNTMQCHFQQVFLTTSSVAPLTCLITTNGYDRTFQMQTATRWESREGPAGVCGILDLTTLQHDGGVRWTMETQRRVTKKGASPECQGADDQLEIMSWQNIRRPLPCAFVQPGGLSR